MAEDSRLKDVATAASALGEVVKLGKESPDARVAGVYAAKSLRIIAQTVHTVLLPLAAANYGAQRFAEYMKERFGPELQERLADVPEEELLTPRTVVAGPVLDSLVYAHEDDELRGLYLSLLASSMDARASTTAHPAFVDVLRQVDSEEIGYLRTVLGKGGDDAWPIVSLRARWIDEDNATITLRRHVLDWCEGDLPVSPEMAAAYVDNWIRLGLVEVSYESWLTTDGVYGWAEGRPEYLELVEVYQRQYSDKREVVIENGILKLTNWGQVFAKAVRVWDAPAGVVGRELGDWRSIARESLRREDEERAARAAAGAQRAEVTPTDI